MTAPRRRIAVIGGGITGLTAARQLTLNAPADVEVCVYEATGRLGGCIHGTDLGGALEIRVDVGAEAALARRPEAVDLAGELGLSVENPGTAKSAIYSRGALHAIPVGTLMGVPADPESAAGLLDDDEVARAARETLTDAVDDDIAVRDFVAGRLGSGVADRLVDPLLGGVYAGDSRYLSLRATVPALWPAAHAGTSALERARELAPKASPGPPAPVFMGLRGGLSSLVDSLADTLGDAVRLNSRVSELGRNGDRWQFTAGGVRETADAVIVAVPARAAAALIEACAPAAATELAGIEFSTSAVVTALVDAGAEPLTGSGFLVPPNEARIVKAATFSSNKWPWIARMLPAGTALLRASMGRHGDTAVLDRDDDDLARAALADVERIVGRPLPALASAVTRWDGALPQYLVGHVGAVARIRGELTHVPGLELAGATYDGVGIPACIGTARRAAESILRELRV